MIVRLFCIQLIDMTNQSSHTATYRIGIDCRLAGKQHAGIGRYVENLVQQLLELKESQAIEWILFFHDEKQAHEIVNNQRLNVKCQYAPIRHYSIEEQTRMPAIFHEAELDLLHVPHFNIPLFYPGRMIVTIHDLLWHEYQGAHVTTLPSWKYTLKHFAYKYTVKEAVKKAERILVPAETVKKTLAEYYPFAKKKTFVTKEGVGEKFQVLSSKFQEVTQPKYLVYVGSLYPHKNIEIVLRSLQQLPDYELLLVGARNVFQDQVRERVKELGVEKQVKFVGYLSDEDLIKTFQHSVALVQPSLFEGFGLTGVEAMASGLPVLASNIPIFKEIYQDGALFFDPKSVESFVKQLREIESEKVRKALIKHGGSVAKHYNWQTMAEQTIGHYLEVLHAK